MIRMFLRTDLHHNSDSESVLQKYPEKFVGCCLADPTDGGGGVRELERLIRKVVVLDPAKPN